MKLAGLSSRSSKPSEYSHGDCTVTSLLGGLTILVCLGLMGFPGCETVITKQRVLGKLGWPITLNNDTCLEMVPFFSSVYRKESRGQTLLSSLPDNILPSFIESVADTVSRSI
jgi:hypothetical protein